MHTQELAPLNEENLLEESTLDLPATAALMFRALMVKFFDGDFARQVLDQVLPFDLPTPRLAHLRVFVPTERPGARYVELEIP